MNHHYEDIRSRIPTPPLWFDENAVPRYSEFGPRESANIYADEAALLHIECQSCGHPFRVCMTWCWSDRALRKVAPLSERVKDLHYGDPPNINCCGAGPTMNSEPKRVLQFWRRESHEWARDASLEIAIDCPWADEPAAPSEGEAAK